LRAVTRRRAGLLGKKMKRTLAAFVGGTVLATLVLAPVSAQQTVRVSGTVEKLEGDTLMVKAPDGASLKITLKSNVEVVGVVKASIADIKAGSYIGSGAMPQADGTQKAVEVHIFAESQRGTGDGHRPWTQPGSTMTNGAVGDAVAGVDGPVVTVKYKGGEKKIVVGPDTPIVRYEAGDKSELKPGAKIRISNAVKKPDGTFEAGRISVGRGDVTP
jgi:Replication factor A protein 3